jgi:hypothetical protein
MTDDDDAEREAAPFKVYSLQTESPEAALARAGLNPSTHAALALGKWGERLGRQDINEVRAELERQAAAASDNDLSRLEGMLTMQAHVLDALFSNLAIRARNTLGHPDAWERFMRMALKAQSQCRTTIETLAEIKNPKPLAIVRQANIAHGHQQVNNGSGAELCPGKAKGKLNELSEEPYGQRLDHGVARPTAGCATAKS